VQLQFQREVLLLILQEYQVLVQVYYLAAPVQELSFLELREQELQELAG
jgi:hypothetical protein